MILRRFYDDGLAQASWMVACPGSKEALIVDPNRDVDQYLRAAEKEGVRVTHVTETHIHADFVSGARELAQRAGATLMLSAQGGEDWSYAYAAGDGATLLRDGDHFRVGAVRIDVMHTPGHTPEHLCFVVTDEATGDHPMGVLTGDFIFVGDVGRPDLLERAAGFEGTMEAGAMTLFASLQRFKDAVPDYVQLWPGHGAGSACGKALGAVPQTTLGYEKLFNWGLRHTSERAFVAEVLAGQPAPPVYFAHMKRVNRDGPRPLGGFRRPPRITEGRVDDLLADGGVVVDTRAAPQWMRQHIPGTLSVPLGKSFATWAGSVIPFDQPFVLMVDEAQLDAAVRDLAMIGMDGAAGWIPVEELDEWVREHGRVGAVTDVDPAELALESAAVVDVRNPGEWLAGHIPGSVNVPLGRLAERIDELPRDRPLVVHCQSGARAAVAIALLRTHGFHDATHLKGDWAGWPGERQAETETPAVAL
jgi:hydroxyacylglutathione hydrolase